MARLQYPNQTAAQARADAIHTQMVNANAPYAASVTAGQTVRWDAARFDGSQWNVTVKPRVHEVLSGPEIAAIVP